MATKTSTKKPSSTVQKTVKTLMASLDGWYSIEKLEALKADPFGGKYAANDPVRVAFSKEIGKILTKCRRNEWDFGVEILEGVLP